MKIALRAHSYDLVYINTAALWKLAPILARRSGSLLWHIHELSYALNTVMADNAWRGTFPLAKRFVAASEGVRETLVNEFEVPGDKVDIVHEFIPLSNLLPDEKKNRRRQIRDQLGLKDDAFVVGGCGALGWRKGTDLFLKIAQAMSRQEGGKTAFVWVGGSATGDEALQFDHDLRALGLQGRCQRVSNCANASDYYYAMDAFALTSREDPFPLVMLEAGVAGLPVVCFDQSGGGPEFVGRTAGLVAPYLDTEVFAKQLAALQNDGELRKKLGTEASRRVAKNHSVETQAPLLLKVIEQCMQTK